MNAPSVAVRRPALAEAVPVIALLAVAAVCWAVTANRMEGMDMGPATQLGGLGWFAGVWAVMMTAMMLPSVAPRASVVFATGFLVPWFAVGLLAYAAVEGIRSLGPSFLAWDAAGPYVAGGVILAAAVYQLTPAKRVCLEHCREHGPPGGAGGLAALRTGIENGATCIGCCWALMAALFALGVMSLQWMIVVAAVIALEKLLPSRRLAVLTTAALLLVLAIGVALDPGVVPGLTVPGDGGGMPGGGMPGEGMSMMSP